MHKNMIIFFSISLQTGVSLMFWFRKYKIIFIYALLFGGLVTKYLLTSSWLSCGTHDVITCKEREIHFKKIYHFL